MIDSFLWLAGYLADAGEVTSGRSREDRRRELDREAQDRTVQPVVPAEELADRRHRKHTMSVVGHLGDASEQGDNKRRTEVVSSEDAVRPKGGLRHRNLTRRRDVAAAAYGYGH